MRTKKPAAPKGQEMEVAEGGAQEDVAAEAQVKKTAGRPVGKSKKKEVSSEELPKRTLRSNSKTALNEVAPAVVVAEVKKAPRKAPAKKTDKTNKVNGKPENVGAEAEVEENDENVELASKMEAAAIKGAKGGKKAAAVSELPPAGEKLETDNEVSENTNDDVVEKDSAKPGKSARGRKKKEDNPATEEMDVVPDEDETEAKEKAGKGRKKVDKSNDNDEEVPSKKTKKETAIKLKKDDAAVKPDKKTGKAKPAAGAAVKEVDLEHWHANRVVQILEPFCSPSVVFSVNKKTPRRGSFEITLILESGEEKVIWSGVKKGPPRNLKFPSDTEVKELAELLL